MNILSKILSFFRKGKIKNPDTVWLTSGFETFRELKEYKITFAVTADTFDEKARQHIEKTKINRSDVEGCQR